MKTFLSFCFAVLAGIILFDTCKKENNDSSFEARFSINSVNRSLLKATKAYALNSAKSAIITITFADGKPSAYTNYSLKLFQMNGQFFTGPVMLRTGNYKLTLFVLSDSSENIIFAAPLEGSPEAQNVNRPLPLSFHIGPNSSEPVNVQVLSTEGKTPDDFGMVSFGVNGVPTFSFLIAVVDIDSNKFIPAKLTVTGDSDYVYVQHLAAIASNLITIRDGFNNYTLEVEADNYENINYTFTNDSLKTFCRGSVSFPLVIKTEIQLIGTVSDNEGNVYKTITIGKQWWMTENLRTAHYNNGDAIKTLLPSQVDVSIKDSIDQRYYFKTVSNLYYGKYYTWYTITDSRGVCPTGWHIPSATEWEQLINHLGGMKAAAPKLKQLSHPSYYPYSWWYDETNNNSSGFTAYPAALRKEDDTFIAYYFWAYFWASDAVSSGTSTEFDMVYQSNEVTKGSRNKYYGLSVRCVKD